jgi:hypothetical protein
MDEYGGHGDLRGSDCRSVIPYVHGRTRVVLLKHALPEPVFLSASQKWRLLDLFIAQDQAVIMSPKVRQVTLSWLKPYTTARVLMARSSKWCLARRQQRGVVVSYLSTAVNMAYPVMPFCRVVSLL